VKFLVDMPLSPMLAAWLRDQGHDAVHAIELGLDQESDLGILGYAKDDSRTVITADLDYPRLLALGRMTGPSLVLFRDGNWSEADVIARLAHVLNILEESEINSSITVIDRERIRRRKLPI
jgi:predicted nuclease of predicted toxin-antitoxin system